MNRFLKFRACLALLVSMFVSLPLFAQEETVITGYQFPEWNECDNITLTGSNSNVKLDSTDPTRITCRPSSSLTVSLSLESDATLIINPYGYNSNKPTTPNIYIDDVLVFQNRIVSGNKNLFVELSSGNHNVKIEYSSNSYDTNYTKNIGVISKNDTKTVNLLEPGSLDTEVLYLDGIDRLQDVHCLKVNGPLNDKDLSTLNKMKDNLFYLDLSGAVFNEIPDNEFYEAKMLHTVVLPEGIQKIGSSAFQLSTLKKINFPSTLTTLGYSCFSNTLIEEAIINEKCLNWLYTSYYNYGYQFQSCYNLKKVRLPEALSTIWCDVFSSCISLSDITFPSALKNIYSNAFENTNIFGETEELVLPNGLTYLGSSAFKNTGYTKLVLPTSFYYFPNIEYYDNGCFRNSKIKEVRLECPTVVKSPTDMFAGINHSDMKLVVPEFLVNSYKAADNWYDFGTITGFSTSEINNWELNSDLTLDAHNRFANSPKLGINENGSFSVVGTDPLAIGDLTIASNLSTNKYGRLISKIDDFSVGGNVTVSEYMEKNKWYYISLPFNVKVGDINPREAAALKAVRYYDGANRAVNGTGNNWVNFAANDVIPAGTGFIFLSSADSWWNFPAQEDESKQYIASNKMFVKELAENDSETASDKGWNLVGNPYQAWYNIHKMNFTAPITVRNVKNNNYEAYSVIDDDYALAPNQAFFVQCTEGTTEISFPVNGRQLTSVVTEQNGAPAKNPQVGRVLVDLALSNGETSDRTRVVLNNKASIGYETMCDASKFLSESNVAQVYTLDREGTMYAINERPVMNGEIQLGVVIPENGTYSFSLLRNMADNVYIRDNETGKTVDITNDVYEFYAKAGTNNTRFTVVLESEVVTGINELTIDPLTIDNCMYNLHGVRVDDSFKGIVIKNGKKVVLK